MNKQWVLNQLRLIWCKIKNMESGGTGGGIQSVQPGTNVTVDNTDPLNPIVNSTGGGGGGGNNFDNIPIIIEEEEVLVNSTALNNGLQIGDYYFHQNPLSFLKTLCRVADGPIYTYNFDITGNFSLMTNPITDSQSLVEFFGWGDLVKVILFKISPNEWEANSERIEAIVTVDPSADLYIDLQYIELVDVTSLNFPTLKILNLSGNNLTQFTSYELNPVSNLEELNLTDNSIESFILTNIYPTSLKTLLIGFNNLYEFSVYSTKIYNQLTRLELPNNNLYEFYLDFTQFPNLTTLVLEINNISDFYFSGDTPTTLRYVRLNENNIQDWEPLEEFFNSLPIGNTSTHHMYVSGNPASIIGTTSYDIIISKGWSISV